MHTVRLERIFFHVLCAEPGAAVVRRIQHRHHLPSKSSLGPYQVC